MDLEINKLTHDQISYPISLKEKGIEKDLYFYGDLAFNDPNTVYVGIIGSRKPSVYGNVVTSKIIERLSGHNCVIVSGFMYGIDMYAHTYAVDKGLRTICVLGYGFNYLFKNFPQYLINQIAYAGGFLTEYEYNINPKKWTFANRNKIVAGLSLLLVVIEAEQKSGSFITCDWGKKFNKQVFAVPGSILSEKSVGTNYLIKEKKATMLSSIDQIDTILHINSLNCIKPSTSPDKFSLFVLNQLQASSQTVDTLSSLLFEKFGADFSKTLNILADLELNKQIKKVGNLYYVL